MGQCCSCVADDATAVPKISQTHSSKQEVSELHTAFHACLRVLASSTLLSSTTVDATPAPIVLTNLEEQPPGSGVQDVGATRLTAVAASADTPVAARSPSIVSPTPSSTEKRHRSVAASPTRFFELLVSLLAKACLQPYSFLGQHLNTCAASYLPIPVLPYCVN